MNDITKLREKYKQQSMSNLQRMQKITEEKNSPDRYVDKRFWKLSANAETGVSEALIRFLPQLDDDVELPFISRSIYFFDHKIGDEKGYYNYASLKSVGKDDPMYKYNHYKWNHCGSLGQDQYRRRKAKKEYIANILVIKDPQNPENDGKVFLYKFGPYIYNMLENKTCPPEGSIEESVNVTDPFEGCNLHLILSKKSQEKNAVANYTTSTFKTVSAISEDDKEVMRILNDRHLMAEFIDPNNTKEYKDYDFLKAKMYELFSDELDDLNVVFGDEPPVERKEKSNANESSEDFSINSTPDEDLFSVSSAKKEGISEEESFDDIFK